MTRGHTYAAFKNHRHESRITITIVNHECDTYTRCMPDVSASTQPERVYCALTSQTSLENSLSDQRYDAPSGAKLEIKRAVKKIRDS